ncbi:MAG: hypothetical protein AB8B85_13530 [Paracoccaceae bacterium]
MQVAMDPVTAKLLGMRPEPNPLRDAFLRWQCRVRQIMMRDDAGRPSDGIMPAVTLAGSDAPLGHIITVMSKAPAHSKTPEMRHIATKTQDPAQIREGALKFFSEFYYQKGAEFSDILTATFPPESEGARAIRRAETATLGFDAFGQRFNLVCKVWKLTAKNPLWQSTYWHNRMFNPGLPETTVILGFEPNWAACSAEPAP